MSTSIPFAPEYSVEIQLKNVDIMVKSMATEWNLTPEEEIMIRPLVSNTLISIKQIEDIWENTLSRDFQGKFDGNFLLYIRSFLKVMVKIQQKVNGSEPPRIPLGSPSKNSNVSENIFQRSTKEFFKEEFLEIRAKTNYQITFLANKLGDNDEYLAQIIKLQSRCYLLKQKLDDLKLKAINIIENSNNKSIETDIETPIEDNKSEDLGVAAVSDKVTPSTLDNRGLKKQISQIFHKGKVSSNFKKS